MEPAFRPSPEPVVPPVAMAPPPQAATAAHPLITIHIEDVKAEVKAEQERSRKDNFYAWWLACEGYGSIF